MMKNAVISMMIYCHMASVSWAGHILEMEQA